MSSTSASPTTAAAAGAAPVQRSIESKLSEELKPTHLQVINESSSHNVPKGSETHFKVVIVSAGFEGKPLLARHRLVNNILSDELASGVHALSIIAKTSTEWSKTQGEVPASPACMGGSKK